MEKDKAEKLMHEWFIKTEECRRRGCLLVGCFPEDLLELKQAISLCTYLLPYGTESTYKKTQFNGVEIITQQLVDIPMNGRI